MLSHSHSASSTFPQYKAMLFALATFMITSPVHAQVFPPGNGISLSGKSRFDQYVEIRDWQDMEVAQGDFRLNAQRAFESALETIGVRRQPSSVDYLVCSIQAISDDNQVAYALALEYWEKHSTDVHVLQWKSDGMNFLAKPAFQPATVAEQCADYFSQEWLKWNMSDS
ncbi:hypothetical protein [Pseudohongiella nitratireducens]|nr:hypothetical protein [Pseudohongiella nitratireducens]|tara:strand:+ start:3824 stop:4330 length:507 start_codon:yes stop_codon:yes gene_type:complete